MERYVAFDVETPNAANDRMSAIGIAVIEDGALVSSFSSLLRSVPLQTVPVSHFPPHLSHFSRISALVAIQPGHLPHFFWRSVSDFSVFYHYFCFV